MGSATCEPWGHEATGSTIPITRRHVLALAALGAATGAAEPARAAPPQGQITYAVHISLAPTWFDPAETSGIITPFMLLYALHDAMAKGMPGQLQSPCLAESWSASEDGLTYDFVLRSGVQFHNGAPVTAEDVKFSFDRYHGASYGLMKERVAAVETPDPLRVTFKLKQPWPDFLTFYAGATGAGWIVPKKYVQQVGDDGFRKAPIGAGPYKFVSFTPGVELVLEAFDQYWRKPPSVKRLVLKVIPDEATRLAALKAGEVDIAYSIRGELAEQLQRIPGLTMKPVVLQGAFWLYFPEQWDPKSPWYDLRVREAANLALDRKTINQALTLGYSHVTGSIMPDNFDFYWAPPAPVYDPTKAKQLLAEAGYPSGFDAGFYTCDSSYANIGEAALDNLAQIGIRAKLRPLERAAFTQGYADKKFRNIIQGASGAFGNVATRMEAFVVKGGAFVYGSYPDIDALYPVQAIEGDHVKRAAILEKMQQLVIDKAIYAPIWQLAFINGVGPRVAESNFDRIPGFAYTAPYEDLSLKTT
jgi:peptide/nickel transport system substrate-binding protein